MFQSARIKLTIWYVLVSMLVSLFFSLGIFFITHREQIRVEQRMESRFQRLRDFNPDFGIPDFTPHRQDFEVAEQNILRNLLYINFIILGLSTIAGYVLAGRTLRPIQESVDKQNQFIADASHELRTPLTALKTAIEVNIRNKKLNLSQAKNVLEDNLVDVDKLKILSEDLLMLATLQKNSAHDFEEFSLTAILKNALSRVTYIAKEKHIGFTTSLKDANIYGDRQKIIDLFVIFLDNAVKYSPTNTKITVRSLVSSSQATITIKDNGIGISEKDLPHIFERFYRAEKSRSTSQEKGYGLGLAIASEIIKLHKGSVSVESKFQKGTTFTVVLPIKK